MTLIGVGEIWVISVIVDQPGYAPIDSMEQNCSTSMVVNEKFSLNILKFLFSSPSNMITLYHPKKKYYSFFQSFLLYFIKKLRELKWMRIKNNERRPHQFVFYENISDNMTFGWISIRHAVTRQKRRKVFYKYTFAYWENINCNLAREIHFNQIVLHC